jgi:hypothetical protein
MMRNFIGLRNDESNFFGSNFIIIGRRI